MKIFFDMRRYFCDRCCKSSYTAFRCEASPQVLRHFTTSFFFLRSDESVSLSSFQVLLFSPRKIGKVPRHARSRINSKGSDRPSGQECGGGGFMFHSFCIC